MNDYIIWHNPRCSKSRQTLALLQENGVEPTEVRYLENPPTPDQIKETLGKLGIPAMDLVRRKEATFKALQLTPETPENDLIQAMSDHPELIERPVVIRGEQAALGRPPENVLALLS